MRSFLKCELNSNAKLIFMMIVGTIGWKLCENYCDQTFNIRLNPALLKTLAGMPVIRTGKL